MDYDKTQKVRVMTAMYNEKTDTICWMVELPSGDQYPMEWPRKAFGAAFGIKGEVAAPLAEEFNQKMIGKEINLVIKKLEQKEE